jgi:cytochrome c551/c552
MKRTLVILLMAGLLTSCGGGKSEDQSSTTTTATPTTEAQVQKVDLSQVPEEWPKLNEELAVKGEKLFAQKGCNACHMVSDQKLVGPGLKGVNKRTTYRWAIAMILNPDSMLKNDERAKQLLKEYGTPMPNQKVTLEEAEAILHYILKVSQ